MSPSPPTVGIVTALAIEAAAVRLLLDDSAAWPPIQHDRNRYRCGTMPSTDPGRPHRVVVALQAQDGTRDAAAICTAMAQSFPHLRAIIMSGIAGGIPAPQHPGRHVRLGDVVVATAGVVDYAHIRMVDGVPHVRRAIGGMSQRLLSADHELEVHEHLGMARWHTDALSRTPPAPRLFARPPDGFDVLTIGRTEVMHPDRRLSHHTEGMPRVHRGFIGSADQLLRDEVRRDQLATDHKIRAIEMESSGLATGANLEEVPWFLVRGIVDYCAESTKTDTWHPYSAWAAAAYVRALLVSRTVDS